MKGLHLKLSLLFFVTLFCFPGSIYAKTASQKQDSLLRLLDKVHTNDERAQLLASISSNYFGINPAKGISYGQQALQIAGNIANVALQAEAANAIGTNFEAMSGYDSALYYYQYALDIAQKNQLAGQIPKMLGNIANVYYYKGDYLRALEMHKKALKISEQAKDDSALSLTLCNMGTVYTQLSLFPEALQCLFNSVKIAEKFGDSVGVGVAYVNIGTIFQRQNNFDKAFEYYNRSLEINLRTGDKRNIAAGYGNIGLVYCVRGEYSKALEYQQKAMALHSDLGDQENLANDLVNTSDLFTKREDFPHAIEYLEKAIAIEVLLGNDYSVAIDKGYIGSVYLAMAKANAGMQRTKYLKLADEYLQFGIVAAKKSTDIATLSGFYRAIAEVQELNGDYRSSSESRAAYIKLNDSVFSRNNQERINNMERERESALTEKELEIRDLEIAKKKRDTTIVVLIAILLCGTTVWAWRNFRTAHNSNMVLTEEKKQHIEQIEHQNKVLLDIAYTQSHNVRGPVSTIIGLINLYNHDDPADPNNKELVEGVVSVSQKLDDIVKDVVEKVNKLEKHPENLT